MRNITLLLCLAYSTALTAFAAKPVNNSPVSLKVTVNTSQQFYSSATNISSDGAPYIDGQNGVCANFNTVGDFSVDFDCTSASPARQLGLNLTAYLAPPTGGTNVCEPLMSTLSAHTNHLGTAQATGQPAAKFQEMQVWSPLNPSSNIYYIEIFIATKFSDANQTAYRLNYHGTVWSGFADAPLASYAQVRRTSSTRWVVESAAPSALAGNPPNVAMLVRQTSTKHSSTITECGFYSVPFSFTLDQQ